MANTCTSVLKWTLIISSVLIVIIALILLVTDQVDLSDYNQAKREAEDKLRTGNQSSVRVPRELRRRFEPNVGVNLLLSLMLILGAIFTLAYFYYWPQMHFIGVSFLIIVLYLILRYVFSADYNIKLVFLVFLYALLELYIISRFMASSNAYQPHRTSRSRRSRKSGKSKRSKRSRTSDHSSR